MNPTALWPAEIIERLLILHKNGMSITEMARRLPFSRPTITAKLEEMGLKAAPARQHVETLGLSAPPPPQVWAPLTQRFEDIENPDRDRYLGPQPKRQFQRSLTGNSSLMCTR